jgi:hypothetical protein
VRTFDGTPWRGKCDVVAGGFPCQDISACGTRAGIDGERSGLWREMSRIIGEIRPRYAFIENSPDLTPTWLDWLMGWPLDWSDSRPLAMDKFRRWLLSHGKPLTVTSGSNADLMQDAGSAASNVK